MSIDNKYSTYHVVENIDGKDYMSIFFELMGKNRDTVYYAKVSEDKWNIVSKYKWYLGKKGYPICYELGKISLHRLIYTLIVGRKIKSNIYVDHIDRDKLNNCDYNLRLATPQENSFNKSTSNNRKGVKKISANNYSAFITKDGIKYEMKQLQNEEEAAKMYNILADELFGEYASHNLI